MTHRQRLSLVFWSASCLGFLVAACSSTSPLRVGFAESDRIVRGKAFAERRCASCHAVSPGAASPRPDAPLFPVIGGKFTPSGLGRELEAIVEVGHYGMPPTAIAPSDQQDLVSYITSMKPPGRAE